MTGKSKPKTVRVRATRSHDLFNEGDVVDVELDPLIEGRINAGYLEVIDGGPDPAPSGPGAAAGGSSA